MLIVSFVSSVAFAETRKGNAGKGGGKGCQTQPMKPKPNNGKPNNGKPDVRPDHGNPVNIVDGTPFSYTGVVTALVNCDSIEMKTDDATVTISGLGPASYWEGLSAKYPQVGDTITVSGYTVDMKDKQINVPMVVTVGEQEISLRDPETAKPLWDKPAGPEPITSGTPFSYSGTVVSVTLSEKGVNRCNNIAIATDNGNVTLSGLGPEKYWETLGIALPVVGDTIEATGYTVDRNGTQVNMLATITVNGNKVELLDANGKPIFKVKMMKHNKRR